MLKPIRSTDARLNSPTDQIPQQRASKAQKTLQFTAQSNFPLPSSFVIQGGARANCAAIQMDDERQAKKPRIRSRPSTPVDKTLKGQQYKSASGWRLEDLRNCSVEIVHGVDPRQMIPEKFFDFKHLGQYDEGTVTGSWTRV